MVDGIDQTANAFQAEISGRAPVQPRNDAGQFAGPPTERMFEPRKVEGDPETGDVRDGGDDSSARRQEARAKPRGGTDGEEERESDEHAAAPDDEGSERTERDPDAHDSGESDGDAEQDAESGDDGEGDGEDSQTFEVVVDGEPKKVKLKEALDGYIRTETFHQRMNKVSEAANLVSQENTKNQQLRDLWVKRSNDLEAEFKAIIPQEPDWDAEFARNPQAAHHLQKQFDGVKAKLSEIRSERTRVEQEKAQEQARITKDYAERGYAQFIMDTGLNDKQALDKEVSYMRKTAIDVGFLEHEIATVYDPRMLKILRKASKYDRIMAAKPKAVIPGRGRTLTPGSGNGASRAGTGRKDINAAQRKLAASGSIDDAADFFKTVLR